MLFSSWEFVLAFLPVTFFVYFWLNHARLVLAGKVWLILANLFFYAYWNIDYLALILASMLVNFAIGNGLTQTRPSVHLKISRRVLLAAGVTANLGLLGYYKYTDFLLENINLRLNALRKALLQSDPATSKVWVVAHALGFTHLGQLSAHYGALFGELPSSTLQRSA